MRNNSVFNRCYMLLVFLLPRVRHSFAQSHGEAYFKQAQAFPPMDAAMNSTHNRVLNGFELHDAILSYVLDPLLMSTLCPVAKTWDDPCFHEGSWQGTVVDVPPWYKPLGSVAWNHFRIWKLAKLVVVRPWMFRYCGLLLDQSVRPWQWSTPRPVLHDIPVVSPSRIVPGLKDSLWRRCRHKWFRIGTPTPIYDIPLRIHINACPPPDLRFGFANTNDVFELTALVTNQCHGCGLLEQDPKLAGVVELQHYYYHCNVRQGNVSFHLNSRMLCETACPQLTGNVVIKFGVADSTLVFAIDDMHFQTPLPANGVCVADNHFPVLVVDERKLPQDLVWLPVAEPLLCRKDGP